MRKRFTSAEFLDGFEAFGAGRSQHYNPFRNYGAEASSKQTDWLDGWAFAKAQHQAREAAENGHSNPWFGVSQLEGYHWVHSTRAGGAVILPICRQSNKIAFVQIRRFPIDTTSLELPRGGAEDIDRSSVETAQRELCEETGIVADVEEFEFLGSVAPDTAINSTVLPIYLVRYDRRRNTGQTDGEADSIVELSLSEIARKIAGGEIACGLTLSALCLYMSKNRPSA